MAGEGRAASGVPSEEVSGLLLCQAAAHPLAFLAGEVELIEALHGDAPLHARAAFAEPRAELVGKLIRLPSGGAVGVDSVEIHAEPVPVLPTPGLMVAGVGGSLYGFATLSGKLYPVLRLDEFSRYLAGLAERHTV